MHLRAGAVGVGGDRGWVGIGGGGGDRGWGGAHRDKTPVRNGPTRWRIQDFSLVANSRGWVGVRPWGSLDPSLPLTTVW